MLPVTVNSGPHPTGWENSPGVDLRQSAPYVPYMSIEQQILRLVTVSRIIQIISEGAHFGIRESKYGTVTGPLSLR